MTREEYTRMVWEETVQNGGCFGRTLMLMVIAVVFCMAFTSCATRTKIEYRDRDVYHYVTKVEKDTVTERVHDSIYIHAKGDSFFVERWHTKYVDRIVLRTDTMWRDSIVTIRKETTKEVVKVPKIYKYSLIISILVIIFATIKLLRWLRVIH